MVFLAAQPEKTDAGSQLRRLIALRWFVLAAMALLVLVTPAVLDIPLPRWPMIGVLGIAAVLNGIAHWRLTGSARPGTDELFSQLLLDIATLSALVFFSGGATNPLVSLLLPPVAIAALTLPARQAAATAVLAIASYSALMGFYLPLPVSDASRATRLHLTGMWLSFAVSSVMIAWFIIRMTDLIRQRDAELALAREQALRDERVMAMGTLAAGTAHELGTPLATMALLAGELAAEPALSAAGREDLAVLRRQIGICKEIISQLARRAGAERLEKTDRQALDAWIANRLEGWHARRPKAASRVLSGPSSPAPPIIADPRLELALLNLLDNAANVSRQTVDIALHWTDQTISIEVRDQGPGFPADVLAAEGKRSFPPHPAGSGMGLMLTRSAIEQLGGRLALGNRPEGGGFARIEMPRVPQ